MLILTIRTDKPEAEVGLFNDEQELAYEKWQAHRELSKTIHQQIAKILQIVSKEWTDIGGVLCYRGPGSFTGLRIGLTVGNALAYGLEIPIVSAGGKDWIKKGVKQILAGKNEKIALPKYGAPVHITKPRK